MTGSSSSSSSNPLLLYSQLQHPAAGLKMMQQALALQDVVHSCQVEAMVALELMQMRCVCVCGLCVCVSVCVCALKHTGCFTTVVCLSLTHL